MSSGRCVKKTFTHVQSHHKPFFTARDPRVKPRTPNQPLLCPTKC